MSLPVGHCHNTIVTVIGTVIAMVNVTTSGLLSLSQYHSTDCHRYCHRYGQCHYQWATVTVIVTIP